MKSVLLSFLLLLLITLPALSHAEENTPAESARELMTPPPEQKLWETTLEGSWLPKSDSSDAGGSVGINEARAKIAAAFSVGPRLTLGPEIVYSLLHISAPPSARLPENLHSISLALRTDYSVNRKLALSFLFAPGIAGDFREIGSEDIRVRFGWMVRWMASEKLGVLGGLIYQQGYRNLPVFPIVGATYRPDDKWTYTLAVPRTGVSYAPGKDMRLDVGMEMSGGEYQLHEERVGAKVIRYRDFRFLGGAAFPIVAGVKGEIAAGYAFAKEFSFHDNFDPSRNDIDVDAGPFIRAGLNLAW